MNNGNLKKASIILGILVILGAGLTGYTEVKIQSKHTKTSLAEFKEETHQDIKDIKTDVRNLLVRTERALTILEDLKRSN